jgi:hypothetical protein
MKTSVVKEDRYTHIKTKDNLLSTISSILKDESKPTPYQLDTFIDITSILLDFLEDQFNGGKHNLQSKYISNTYVNNLKFTDNNEWPLQIKVVTCAQLFNILTIHDNFINKDIKYDRLIDQARRLIILNATSLRNIAELNSVLCFFINKIASTEDHIKKLLTLKDSIIYLIKHRFEMTVVLKNDHIFNTNILDLDDLTELINIYFTNRTVDMNFISLLRNGLECLTQLKDEDKKDKRLFKHLKDNLMLYHHYLYSIYKNNKEPVTLDMVYTIFRHLHMNDILIPYNIYLETGLKPEDIKVRSVFVFEVKDHEQRKENKVCICGAKDKLMRCSRCKKVYYCSRTCQVKDSPIHSKVCIL